MNEEIAADKIVLTKKGFKLYGKANMLAGKCPLCGAKTLLVFDKANFMPCCGGMNEGYKDALLRIFVAQRLNSDFDEAKRLLFMAEFASSARSASIAMEFYLKGKVKRSDLFGVKLVKYVFDSENGQPPRILINKYATQVEINEQEGLSLLTQGMLKCVRNPLMHNDSIIDAGSALATILHCNFVIDLIESGSLTEGRKEERYECDIEGFLKEEADRFGFEFEVEK